MPRFVLSVRAKKDITSIGRYTAKTWGKLQRNRSLSEITNAFNILTTPKFPHVRCTEFQQTFYRYNVGKHIVFYDIIEKDTIEIVRILHQSMDIPTQLSE